MARAVAVVSDTSSVGADLAQRLDVSTVPLHVVIRTRSYDEGSDATPERVAAALREHTPVSTSRPAPEAFVTAYEQAAAAGAESVVSIHLSGDASGTFEAAQIAARRVAIPVEVVDSRQFGMGAGFAVQSAVEALDKGATAAEAAEVARVRAAETTVLFYVDTLEFLRRGGRVGTTAALVGSALAVKPLLQVKDGRIVPLEKVRTASKALARLEDLALAAAGDRAVDIAVSHLDNNDRAQTLGAALAEKVPGLHELVVSQVGAVIAAHVGPGVLGVVLAPR